MSKATQSQRTKAPNIGRTPRAAQLTQKQNGPSGGQTAPVKFKVKK